MLRDDDLLLTDEQLARLCNRSVFAVRRDRALRQGCPWIKIQRQVRYQLGTVRKWLESNKQVTNERIV